MLKFMPASKKRSTVTKKTSKNLPNPPSLWQTIGPSFILLGLALGSGELILWPYLSASWGLGLMWGGLLGITLQFILNTETMRYSLARGESVFVGFRKLSGIWPLWFIISTFIPWSLPGFSSASSQIINNLLGLEFERGISIALLLLTGFILTIGKTLYRTMEVLQRTIIIIGLPIMFGLTLWLANSQDWTDLAWGVIGRGEGWWFFPPGIAIASFLGAFAYSGAGGNLNLAQSYYIKEKGFGMGKYLDKISSLFAGGNKVVKIEGTLFSDTTSNYSLWKKWWRLVNTEHFLVFWILGFLSITMISVLAKTLTFGQAEGEGIIFLYQQAAAIAERTFPLMGTTFLMLAGLMLFSTQIGVLESSSRIISENILLLFYKPGRKFNLSLAFYASLWGQILLGIVILFSGFQEPRFLLTLGAVLNGAAMMVAFPLLFVLNKHQLPERYRPGIFRQVLIMAGLCFFALFFVFLLRDML